MDSPLGSIPSSNDENPRVKFLCSFSGNILPRPQDGKLRYVGGETRIVSVPREISYQELMCKMRELYEGTTVLKYQQPDEDLDALVSVVNDDDVTNMMEEYDKLGSGDGFTRLRIFLFANNYTDQEHFGDVDERDHERRYVDALNSHNESPEFFVGSGEDGHVSTEQYFNQMNLEGLPMAQMNLRRLTIPHINGSQTPVMQQRYSNEVEAPCSPAYFSPRQNSPRMPEMNTHFVYEQQPQYPDNVVLIPTCSVVNERPGFPGNVLQGPPNVYEGKSICEHCRMSFHRNQEPPPNMGNGYHSCAECHTNRHPSYYFRDQNERDRISPRQSNHWAENGMSSMPLGCDGGHHIHYGNQVFQDQAMATGSHIHLPSIEDRGVRYANPSYTTYGAENAYQIHSQTQWRNVHTPVQGGGPPPSYETSVPPQLVNGSLSTTGFVRETMEGTPRLQTILENQNPSRRNFGFDGSLIPEYSHTQAVKPTPNTYTLENQHPHAMKDHSTKLDPASFVNDKVNENGVYEESREINNGVIDTNSNALAPSSSINSKVIENGGATKVDETNVTSIPKDDRLDFLPELIASVKEAAVQNLQEVKAKVQEDSKEDTQNDTDGLDHNVDLAIDSDIDNNTKIEPTKAEAEALDRGLQTIKNDDLEEIRELGSGTYGAVFHGKWKGSDVAIKRIKASCFAGKPSERERLIADFWKEALILSSLHHPNVVSFYGVVRDGPDGSLATLTEFMVNGSLKQFLRKKDRTIDRRKRLIIAMDTAFGMEYLHGKNIVHFDLKCENLLVNMRDPHRPVCKIGDLGLSKVKQHTLVSGGVRGTLPWMAPELLSGKSNMVTEKIDVYSFGIVMWELLTGDEPYADIHCASIIGGIVNNTLRPQTPTWCDPEWKALMESCWASDPSQRPSFSEISQKLRNMAAAMNLK
ncbi:hypothetical protein ACJIZ3_005444 [Penstemon smallii]|uniref:Protein kinase domain-containing protein n=1 Tax=Penstemon smallii TaxID=265156 RepID=A0ABD3S512_9LAMI